jgi:hypothetical protein
MSNLAHPHRVLRYWLDVSKSTFPAFRCGLRDTVVVAGTPRSGTTWLMELLGLMSGYRTLFEPLHRNWFPEASDAGFSPRDYINPNALASQKEEYLRKVFEGRVASKVPHYSLNPMTIIHRCLSDKLIVKFVRANRLVPWIAERFAVRGIIVLLRHPCAVVESQLRRGINGYFLPNTAPALPEMVLADAQKLSGDIVDGRLLEFVANLKAPHEGLAAIWALDTLVPLYYWKDYGYFIATYEDIIRNKGDKAIGKVLDHLGVKENAARITQRAISSPSALTTKSKTEFSSAERILSSWKGRLGTRQATRILEIVNEFGLDFYTCKLEPDLRKLQKWSPSRMTSGID